MANDKFHDRFKALNLGEGYVHKEYPKYVRIPGIKEEFIAASKEEELAILEKHGPGSVADQQENTGKRTLKLGAGKE